MDDADEHTRRPPRRTRRLASSVLSPVVVVVVVWLDLIRPDRLEPGRAAGRQRPMALLTLLAVAAVAAVLVAALVP